MKTRVVCFAAVVVCCILTAAWLRQSCWHRRFSPLFLGGEAVLEAEDTHVDDFTARAKRIEEVCLKHRRALYGAHYMGTRSNKRLGRPAHCPARQCPIFVDHSHRVAFCFIPKVASTSVKTFFADLLNVSNPSIGPYSVHSVFNEKVLRVGPSHFPRSKLKKYARVIFVRHPFERLVSAFADKAGKPRSQERFFYEVYWDKAIPGRNGSQHPGSEKALTFSVFVDYILSKPDHQWDDHWAPYYSRCEPCIFKYDVVGKLETGDRDFALLFARLGLRNGSVRVPPRKNSSKGRGVGRDGASRKSARDYFAELSSSQVKRLYERYYYDFELFGYDARGYLPAG